MPLGKLFGQFVYSGIVRHVETVHVFMLFQEGVGELVNFVCILGMDRNDLLCLFGHSTLQESVLAFQLFDLCVKFFDGLTLLVQLCVDVGHYLFLCGGRDAEPCHGCVIGSTAEVVDGDTEKQAYLCDMVRVKVLAISVPKTVKGGLRNACQIDDVRFGDTSFFFAYMKSI